MLKGVTNKHLNREIRSCMGDKKRNLDYKHIRIVTYMQDIFCFLQSCSWFNSDSFVTYWMPIRLTYLLIFLKTGTFCSVVHVQAPLSNRILSKTAPPLTASGPGGKFKVKKNRKRNCFEPFYLNLLPFSLFIQSLVYGSGYLFI